MISALAIAIYNKGITGDFGDGLTSTSSVPHFFNTTVKRGTVMPYAYFFEVSPNTSIDSGNRFEVCRVQFTIVAKTNAEVLDLQTKLWALFDEATLTVTGYSFVGLQREAPSGLVFEREGTWHSITQYRFEIQKTR